MKRVQYVACAAALAAAGLGVSSTAQADDFRMYFVGNSVTDLINYNGMKALAQQGGHNQIWGRQMIPGAPLSWLWDHPADGFMQNPFGYPSNAFPNYTWDAISLQPFDRHLTGSDGDIQEAHNFIDLALTNSTNSSTQFYVYSRWPRRESDGSLDYAARWSQHYTGGWDSTNETQEYFQLLTSQLRTDYAGVLDKPVLLVPVGDALANLDAKIRAGEAPGLSSITDVFADGIHLNNIGSFVVGLTYYSTVYKTDPHGVTVPTEYGTIDPALLPILEDSVWSAVTSEPLSGVAAVPEPASLGLLAIGALAMLRRRVR